ncbi:hypothetical protein NDN08_007652 [Rhodosorus marinus]|uniref:SGNH hydrolase-type esterase domain-containing protein n=1 Tax=Rhodosorus marinus TaxID=101924 RepID=A0AAV8V3Q4_9RHOD|nr:hypothetical protein NDN08_007652 [Rhodosorus marinus]
MNRKRVLFLGDSLTQNGMNQELCGFVGSFAHAYQRHADVVLRGYSGYNTTMVMDRIDSILVGVPRILHLCVICLGANDAAIIGAGTNNDVDVETYTKNLKQLILLLKERETQNIVLMTPPFVDLGKPDGVTPVRTAEHTERYADAVLQLAIEEGVHSIDLFSTTNESDLVDGIHFNSKGNKHVYKQLEVLIADKIPDMDIVNIETDLPDWKDICKPDPDVVATMLKTS